VELYTNLTEGSVLRVGEQQHKGAAAWFAGIDDGVCIFGADTSELRAGESIVGTMCHEVAHAFRAHHGLESTTRQIDEEHTDITTIVIWCDRAKLAAPLQVGDRVHATGQTFRVMLDKSSPLRFIASSVVRDDRR
jgi:hypothetical protein